MCNVKFRPAALTDVDELFKIKLKAFSEEFEQFGYANYEGMQAAVDSCKPENIENSFFSYKWHKLFCNFGEMEINGVNEWTVTIMDGEKIIGSICVLPADQSGEEYPGIEMTADINVLISMYVLPEYKNKGVGAKAIRYMEQIHPSERWILDTPAISAKNMKFYQKCGYKPYAKCGELGQIFTKGF